MQISLYNNTYQKPIKSSNLSFEGRNWNERIGRNVLIHETSFFREPETDKFVKDYLVKNFLSKNLPVDIVVGACSSGEEVYSQAMLYNEYKNKVNILGFDISEKAIEDAKNGMFIIFEDFNLDFDEKPTLYKDSYLLFKKESQEERELALLFKEHFQTKDEKEIPQHLNPEYRGMNYRIKRKGCQAKKQLKERCKFVQGDINILDNILKDNSVNVLFFRNAMYHLVCDINNSRVPKKNDEQIMQRTIFEMSKKLKKDGLIVFGEKEFEQGVDIKKLYRIMKESGFEPLNTEYRISKLPYRPLGYSEPFYTNVWRKKS